MITLKKAVLEFSGDEASLETILGCTKAFMGLTKDIDILTIRQIAILSTFLHENNVNEPFIPNSDDPSSIHILKTQITNILKPIKMGTHQQK